MTRVARIELFHVAIPLPDWFRPAWIPGMPQTENRCTLIRVLTDDGIEGWSAGPAIGRERAGLGFDIDRRALRRWGKRFFVMDRKRLVWFSLRHRGIAVSREIDRVRRKRLG